jgi:hypothetical protein
MQDQQDEQRHTGQYGGDDGALEHERERIEPGEDPGLKGTPAGARRREKVPDADQAQRKQDRDLETGAENPA